MALEKSKGLTLCLKHSEKRNPIAQTQRSIISSSRESDAMLIISVVIHTHKIVEL